MKTLRFLIDCHDKNTGEGYPVGTVKEFEDERADEILAVKGAVEEVFEEEETEQGETDGENPKDKEKLKTKK